jgi:hypothetical protein
MSKRTSQLLACMYTCTVTLSQLPADVPVAVTVLADGESQDEQ